MPIFYLSESSINDYQKIEFELIEKETNKASKIIFGKFKNIFNKNDKSDYNQFRLEELKQFYKDNKDFPTVKSIKKDDTDLYCIYLDIKGDNHDFYLFYQDLVCKELNKNDKLRKNKYKFKTEDYPGIYILF